MGLKIGSIPQIKIRRVDVSDSSRSLVGLDAESKKVSKVGVGISPDSQELQQPMGSFKQQSTVS